MQKLLLRLLAQLLDSVISELNLGSRIPPCCVFCSLSACIAWAPGGGTLDGLCNNIFMKWKSDFSKRAIPISPDDDDGGTGQRNAVTRLNSEAVK